MKRDPIYGVRLGGKDRSYLIKNGQIDVLRNVIGGVQVKLCPLLIIIHHQELNLNVNSTGYCVWPAPESLSAKCRSMPLLVSINLQALGSILSP